MTTPASILDPANSVIGKVSLLLDAFTFEDIDLSLSELVRSSGLCKPTVHRLCSELLTWGYLERHGTRYRLGIRLFEIGQRVPDQGLLRDAARPAMSELQVRTGGTVHLAVRVRTEVLYLEKLAGRARALASPIAGRMPMHCTASGKVLLAHAGSEVRASVLRDPMTRLTSHTIVAPSQLARGLAQVRTLGWAYEREEARLGYLSVAAPIIDTQGQVVAAISSTVPAFRAEIGQLRNLVTRAAAEASTALASGMTRPRGGSLAS